MRLGSPNLCPHQRHVGLPSRLKNINHHCLRENKIVHSSTRVLNYYRLISHAPLTGRTRKLGTLAVASSESLRRENCDGALAMQAGLAARVVLMNSTLQGESWLLRPWRHMGSPTQSADDRKCAPKCAPKANTRCSLAGQEMKGAVAVGPSPRVLMVTGESRPEGPDPTQAPSCGSRKRVVRTTPPQD